MTRAERRRSYRLLGPVPADRLAGIARELSRPAVPAVGPSPGRHGTQVPTAVLERTAQLAADGCSLDTVAAILNREGLTTPQGLCWHARSIARSIAAAELASTG